MVLWRDRHVVYKIGFCGLLMGILVYVLGYSLPYWSILRLTAYGYSDQTIGLWQACLHDTLTCISNVHNTNPPWLNATRALNSLALVLFAFGLISGCYRNMTNVGQISATSPGRHVEGLGLVASFTGGVGCIIYAAEFHRIYVSQYDVGHLYWAFGLVSAALGVAGISSAAMFAYNPRGDQRNSRRCGHRCARTVRVVRGPNGLPVSVQFPADLGDDERFHIPYFGDVTPEQLVQGATPTQPPSYETATGGSGYDVPPADASEAPPVYEDVTKDSVLPPEVVAHLRSQNKDCAGAGGGGGGSDSANQE